MCNSAAETQNLQEKALPRLNGVERSDLVNSIARQRQSGKSISSADQTDTETETNGTPTESEREVLDRVADALARLGRVSRVSLMVEDKIEFVSLRSGKKR